jgi:hypothetical protein
MAQSVLAASPFYDANGFFLDPEAAAAYAIVASGGQSFTTPAREARRMLAGGHPHYVPVARNWLAARGLPELGDSEPPDWQNWMTNWIKDHPGPEAAMAIARALPPEQPAAAQPPPQLHLVPPAPPKKVVVHVEPGSRLESLLALRDAAKAAVDAAEAQMRTVKDGITAELTAMHPGTGAFDIPAAPGRSALTLRYSAPNMFDAKRFKEERPDLYPNYLKPSPRWTLGAPPKKAE